jgi:hypothetical protein
VVVQVPFVLRPVEKFNIGVLFEQFGHRLRHGMLSSFRRSAVPA